MTWKNVVCLKCNVLMTNREILQNIQWLKMGTVSVALLHATSVTMLPEQSDVLHRIYYDGIISFV